jgi:hypothetical protein
MTWTITTILKTVRIKDRQFVLIQAKALSVFASSFAQLPIIEPMLAEIVVLGEESANPDDRCPFTSCVSVDLPLHLMRGWTRSAVRSFQEILYAILAKLLGC